MIGLLCDLNTGMVTCRHRGGVHRLHASDVFIRADLAFSDDAIMILDNGTLRPATDIERQMAWMLPTVHAVRMSKQ